MVHGYSEIAEYEIIIQYNGKELRNSCRYSFCVFLILDHTSSPNFFLGGGGPRKIFGAPPARKNKGSQIFRCGGTENR